MTEGLAFTGLCKGDQDGPVRLAVNATGSIIADCGITVWKCPNSWGYTCTCTVDTKAPDHLLYTCSSLVAAYMYVYMYM